jgi:hypothetical protein
MRSLTKLPIICSLLATFLFSLASLHATVFIASDDFNLADYGASETSINGLGGGSGWSSNWSLATGTTANFHPDRNRVWSATGYVNTGASSEAGGSGGINAVGSDTNRIDRNLDVSDPFTSGHIWVSFVKDQQSVTGVSKRLTLSFGTVSDSITFGTQGGNVGIGSSPGFINLASSTGNTTGPSLMLGHIDIDNDVVNLWYNPTDMSSITALGTPTVTHSLGITSVSSTVRIHIQNDSNTRITMDALRIASSSDAGMGLMAVATAVPEPQTYALILGLVAVAALALKRRIR